MYPISLIYLAKQENSLGLQERNTFGHKDSSIWRMCQAIYQITRSILGRAKAQTILRYLLIFTCYYLPVAVLFSKEEETFSWFPAAFFMKKRNFCFIWIFSTWFSLRIIDVESCGMYAHILFVLKENPSRRVNLTPLSTHDWKTRTPSSWSKQCSTRFQISLLESCDKKQLFF